MLPPKLLPLWVVWRTHHPLQAKKKRKNKYRCTVHLSRFSAWRDGRQCHRQTLVSCTHRAILCSWDRSLLAPAKARTSTGRQSLGPRECAAHRVGGVGGYWAATLGLAMKSCTKRQRREEGCRPPSQMCCTSGGWRGLDGRLVSGTARAVDEDLHQAVLL
jgi:hypothetical protein